MIPHELCVRIYELVSEFELCMQRYIYDQALFDFSFFFGGGWSVTFLGFFFWILLRDFCLPSRQIDCYCLRSICGFRLLVRC